MASSQTPQTFYNTQNSLLLGKLMQFYEDKDLLKKMLEIITGESRISLRIVDWFVTNFSKKYYTVYPILEEGVVTKRFKVYVDYKLKLRAYSKKRFDPFCRWERISIPYQPDMMIETTLGQLNFFKWSLENKVIDYIEEHFDEIERDMNHRNSISRRKEQTGGLDSKTRKKREELSVSATKSIKKEDVQIVVTFK